MVTQTAYNIDEVHIWFLWNAGDLSAVGSGDESLYVNTFLVLLPMSRPSPHSSRLIPEPSPHPYRTSSAAIRQLFRDKKHFELERAQPELGRRVSPMSHDVPSSRHSSPVAGGGRPASGSDGIDDTKHHLLQSPNMRLSRSPSWPFSTSLNVLQNISYSVPKSFLYLITSDARCW